MSRFISWLIARVWSTFSRLRNAARADRLPDDIEREMAFHLHERTDDLVAAGMPRNAAGYEARRRFGNFAMQKERTRERNIFRSLDLLAADLRYAVRSLRSTPALALVAVLSLGLGIGANTAIFTLINAVMLESLPVSHPEELVKVVRDENTDFFTNPLWEGIRDHEDVFSGVFAFGPEQFNLTEGGAARRVAGNYVSGAFFSTLGVRAALGRPLLPGDDYRGCPGVAVLSDAFWRSEFGGNDGAIGRSLPLDGHSFQIVGVAEPGFLGVDVGETANVYVPLCNEALLRGAESGLDRRSQWFLQIVGRPKSGLTPAQLRAQLSAVAPGIADATTPPNWPSDLVEHYRKMTLGTLPVPKGFSHLRMTYGKALLVLMAVVGIVLLIACANVANLLLARAATRQREIAVRLALGASRARLVRQLLTESVLLAACGAAVGVLFARWGSRLLVTLLSRTGQAVSLDLSLDLVVLGFTVAVAMGTGILFGLAPAWRGSRVDPHSAMKSQGRGLAEGHSRFSVGKALVVGQIALSLVLVAGAGLLLGSWRRLATVDTGFRREYVLLVGANLDNAGIAREQRAATMAQMLERVRGLPGVQRASLSAITPVGPAAWNEEVDADGFVPKSREDNVVWFNEVSDGYFATLGTRMIAGRDFDRRDVPTTAVVVIVNEALTKKFFGTTNALGKRLRTRDGKNWSAPLEIVGVVADTKYRSLSEAPQPIAYRASSQDVAPGGSINLELQTTGDAAKLAPAVTATFAELNPRILLEFSTLDGQIADSLTLPRTLASLSGFFGALALLLAMIGLYGIMSYSVARRRNEIGVRIALGAAHGRVVRMVLGEVGRMVTIGVVIGVALTFGVTRLVASFLYGVEANDPATLTASALALLVVALGAAMLPAWRAARLDPVSALRED